MQPVSGGTQKVTFDKESEREYESQRRAAVAQAANNPYVSGIGMEVKDSRTGYGAPRVMPEELIEGISSNFAQKDSPGNAPLDDAMNTTGSVANEVSATEIPEEDPQSFQTDALDKRLAMMRSGGQVRGLNDHDRTYGA